jgi:hypothetical protein
MTAMTATSAPATGTHDDPALDESPVLERISAYWNQLGLVDEDLIASLSRDCLASARRRVGRASSADLLRRALEEAQRRFDHALATAAGLPPTNDPHPLAAARAALLLSDGFPADSLFAHDDVTRHLKERLAHSLPQPTPPEARVTMTPVPLRFWLFKSTDH